MPTPKLSDELAQEAINLVTEHGGVKQAARKLGIPHRRLDYRMRTALIRGMTPNIRVSPHVSGTVGFRVLAIGDLHAPFMHPDAVEFLKCAKEELKPNRIVFLGDETDQHALSQYQADPDGYSAGVEGQKAKEQLAPLYTMFPDARICESNHTERVYKKAFRAGIPSMYLRSYAEFLESPVGWQWQHKFVYDGVTYEHGEGVSGKTAAEKKMMANMGKTVIGHIHAHAGTYYFNNGVEQIWGMNAGCLIDSTQYAFKYAKHSIPKPILGVGFVDCGEPHFYPMRLDKNKRWTGKL